MKHCTNCGTNKPENEFNRKHDTADGLQSRCRKCCNEVSKQHYKDNKKYYIDKSQKNGKYRIGRNQKFICDFLRDHPCVDCGETNIICLDFDHIFTDKIANISKLIFNSGRDKIELEMLKCEVVCANCHRIRTANRQKSYRMTL